MFLYNWYIRIYTDFCNISTSVTIKEKVEGKVLNVKINKQKKN